MGNLIYKETVEFIWDSGNENKNYKKHQVTDRECEEVFFDKNKKVSKDSIHSQDEARHILLGDTKFGRLLYTVFTVREGKVRVISSRDMNKKEKKLYQS